MLVKFRVMRWLEVDLLSAHVFAQWSGKMSGKMNAKDATLVSQIVVKT